MKMKLVSVSIVLSILANVYAYEDFYTDEKGRTYTIGIFGEKLYDSEDEGRRVIEPRDNVKFTHKKEFTEFGWKLFKKMNHRSIENYVISSLSPQLLLSLISERSRKETRSEILEAIKIPDFNKLGKVTKALQSEDSARTLKIASVFLVNANMNQSLNKNYIEQALQSNVDVQILDFSDVALTQKKYDEWLSRITQGVINNQQLTLDDNTKMIMSSALFFKGDWLFEFSKPKPGKFKTSNRNEVDVEMVSTEFKKYHYGYLSNDNGEWVSIPYNSTEAMVILLPADGKFERLHDFLAATPFTDITDIVDIIAQSYPPHTLVNITLPKFKIKSSVDLKESLQKMGINEIFSEQSQFFPFENEVEPLQVSSATQECSLEVTEKGSVGAAVTKFSIVALSVQARVKEASFVVNRPFIAIIVNRVHGIPYFIAKVTNPTVQ